MSQHDIVSEGVTPVAPLRMDAHDAWDTFGGAPVYARTLVDVRTYASESDIEDNLYDIGWVDYKYRKNALVNPNDSSQIAWFDGYLWHLALRLRATDSQSSEIPDVGTISRRIVLPSVVIIPLLVENATDREEGEHCRRIIPPPNSVAIVRNVCGRRVEFRISRSRSNRRIQLYAEAILTGPRCNHDGSPRSMLYLGDHCLTFGLNAKVHEVVGQVLQGLVDWIFAQNCRVDPAIERSDLLRIGKLISLPKAKDVAAAVALGQGEPFVSCALPPFGYTIGSLLDAHARLGELEARMLRSRHSARSNVEYERGSVVVMRARGFTMGKQPSRPWDR